jgi:hypothetical protein
MNTLLTIYKQATRLLPAAYRDQYAEPMVQTLEDMMSGQPTRIARWKVWLRTMLDLPLTTAYQYIQIGGITMSQAPDYAKRGTLLGAVLLLPFIVAVTLNSIHPIPQHWSRMGYFSIFIMPVIALLLSLAILVRLLMANDLWSRVKDIKQLQNNWMLLMVPLLALGMALFAFGHDSVHCVTDGHMHPIVQCVLN